MRTFLMVFFLAALAWTAQAEPLGPDTKPGLDTTVGGQRIVTPQFFPGLTTSATATNPETGTRRGPGFERLDPSQPYIFSTRVTRPSADNIDGAYLFTKTVDYTGRGVTSYIGAGAINAYTLHKGDTHNNEAAVVGTIMTSNTGNSQPFGTGSSVGVAGGDICEVAGCIAGWGGLFNTLEKPVSVDPVNLHYGAEIGVFANGTDRYQHRTGLLIAAHKTDPNGPNAEIGNALFIVPERGTYFDAGINLTKLGDTRSYVLLAAGGTIDWSNAAGSLDRTRFTAGSRLFKATDNNVYFDNYDANATHAAAVGFFWRVGQYPTTIATLASLTSSGFDVKAPVTAPRFAETLSTPASSKAACKPGQFTDDANYHYVCVATNKWRRVALSDF